MKETRLGTQFTGNWISLSVPDGILLGAVLFVLCYALFFRRSRPKGLLWIGLLFLYLGAVLALTQKIILPPGVHVQTHTTELALRSINWKPFESVGQLWRNCVATGHYREYIRLVGGNLALLMPLGVLVPLIWPGFTLARMAFLSAVAAFTLEGLQLVFNILEGAVSRTVEIDDFILNALGCLLAYVVFAILRRVWQAARRLSGRRPDNT